MGCLVFYAHSLNECGALSKHLCWLDNSYALLYAACADIILSLSIAGRAAHGQVQLQRSTEAAGPSGIPFSLAVGRQFGQVLQSFTSAAQEAGPSDLTGPAE